MNFKYSDILKNNVKFKRVLDTLEPISLKHIEIDCLRLHDVINNHEQWLDIKQKYLREYDPDTGLHVHSWHEFSLIDYGEIEYYTEKKRFVVKDQGFFFMPPGIRHGWVPLTTDYLIFGFHLKFTATSIVGERIIRELEQRLKERSFHIEATDRVREIIQEIRSIEDNSPLSIHKTEALVLSFLYECLELAFGDILLKNDVEDVLRNKNQDLTKQIIELIHENVSLPLQLEDIARHFDHSSRHLNRIFTSVEGLSIGKYILKHKMSMACQVLVKDDRPIKTVAYEFGFNEPSYFCRIFKKTFGASPQAYRAKNSRI